MPKVSQMQGVPAQIERLKPNDNKRRHPAHCIFADGKGKARRCTCTQSPKYLGKCNSAKQCDYYVE